MSSPLHDILTRIDAARKKASHPRPPRPWWRVSKTHGPDAILPVLDEGHRVFGENRVQEAQAKWPALKQRFPDIQLHLIGPLQSNKTREAVELFDTIHTLDRPKLAHALKAEMERTGRAPALFIQGQHGRGAAKSRRLTRRRAAAHRTRPRARIAFEGPDVHPTRGRATAPHFALLQKLTREHALPWLSMGMSSDFETAIKFGATHVRVGSAGCSARRAST